MGAFQWAGFIVMLYPYAMPYSTTTAPDGYPCRIPKKVALYGVGARAPGIHPAMFVLKTSF